MYLEFHRGTYTTHVKTKQGNRRTEHLLFEAELWCATAALLTGYAYPYDEIDDLWRTALLMQFHDILPGSSIRWVHREAHQTFDDLRERLEAVIAGALDALGAHASRASAGASDPTAAAARGTVNPSPFPRNGVAAFAAAPAESTPGAAAARWDGDEVVLDNGLLRVRVAADGTALSSFPPCLSPSIDLDSTESLGVTSTDVVRASSLVVRVTGQPRARPGEARRRRVMARRRGSSPSPDLHATHHVRDPVRASAVRARQHVGRRHVRDAAQRWVHVGEAGYGVAVVNRGTYGHDISRPTGGDGRGAEPTTVRLSLVRGPLYPDPRADEGQHSFSVSVLAGADLLDATKRVRRFVDDRSGDIVAPRRAGRDHLPSQSTGSRRETTVVNLLATDGRPNTGERRVRRGG
jgi:alpha-mannosidase